MRSSQFLDSCAVFVLRSLLVQAPVESPGRNRDSGLYCRRFSSFGSTSLNASSMSVPGVTPSL